MLLNLRDFLFVFLVSTVAHSSPYRVLLNEAGKGYSVKLVGSSTWQAVVFEGKIEFSDTKAPLANLEKYLVSGKRTYLLIDSSNGGHLQTYLNFGDMLSRKCNAKQNCRLTAYVRNTCASACVHFFLKMPERFASENAMFGFHRTSFLGSSVLVESERRSAKVLVDLGMDPSWMQANQSKLFAREYQRRCYWIGSQTAIKARVVTAIDDGLLENNYLALRNFH